jgi:predicted O-methyltransferase YrrM
VSKLDRAWLPGPADLDWIERNGRPPNPVLVEMEEAAGGGERIPILDRDSGRALAVLAAGRRRVVEIGTAIGYSTLWMALAQPEGGTIATIDPDRDRTDRARDYWRRAGVPDEQVKLVNAPALDAFAAGAQELAGPFDLAFVDALKEEYGEYFDALRTRLEPGGLLVADNVLWSGRTSGSRPSTDGDGTRELQAFCHRVAEDRSFETTILPIGDGLLIATFRG